jgi:hypothetical protein
MLALLSFSLLASRASAGAADGSRAFFAIFAPMLDAPE